MLSWWETIATWTGFCEGDSCTDGAIPYLNLNDWFHFSSAVLVTTPGTPEYVEPLSTNRSDNDDNWTRTSYGPARSMTPQNAGGTMVRQPPPHPHRADVRLQKSISLRNVLCILAP